MAAHEHLRATTDSVAVPALPTETKVESGTSLSKSGTSLNLSNSGTRTRAGTDGSGLTPEVRDGKTLAPHCSQLFSVRGHQWGVALPPLPSEEGTTETGLRASS